MVIKVTRSAVVPSAHTVQDEAEEQSETLRDSTCGDIANDERRTICNRMSQLDERYVCVD
jgi:hypothetical protein